MVSRRTHLHTRPAQLAASTIMVWCLSFDSFQYFFPQFSRFFFIQTPSTFMRIGNQLVCATVWMIISYTRHFGVLIAVYYFCVSMLLVSKTKNFKYHKLWKRAALLTIFTRKKNQMAIANKPIFILVFYWFDSNIGLLCVDHVTVACLIDRLRFETGKKYFTFTLSFRYFCGHLDDRDANVFRRQLACFSRSLCSK